MDQQFRLPPIDVVISNKQAQVQIALHVDGDGGHPISGFPRPLTTVEKKVIRHRQALAAVRPGTALNTVRSGSGSGSASISIHSRSSRPWSPPYPERHASIASAMSPTASAMSLPHTISTNQTRERDTGSADYPETPATTVTNHSFPIQGYLTPSQAAEEPDDTFEPEDGRETPQQRDYPSSLETPHQRDYISTWEVPLSRHGPLPRDYPPTRESPQPRASPRPPQLSLNISDSGLLQDQATNSSNVSLDVVNLPASDNVASRTETGKKSRKDGPYELEANTHAPKLSKTTYSPFPLRQRKPSRALDQQFGPPLSTPSNPLPKQTPPPHRLQASNGDEIPRGDSPVLGMDSDSSPQEDKKRYGRQRSPPAAREAPRPSPMPRNRANRDKAEPLLPSHYPSFRNNESRVADSLFRTYIEDPIRRGKQSAMQPQTLLNPTYVARGIDNTSGIVDMYHQSQLDLQRSDSGAEGERGIFSENQERLQSEDGMPLEFRLRKLEELVGKLEQENSRIGGKGITKRGRGIGSISGLMK